MKKENEQTTSDLTSLSRRLSSTFFATLKLQAFAPAAPWYSPEISVGLQLIGTDSRIVLSFYYKWADYDKRSQRNSIAGFSSILESILDTGARIE